jgi:NADPH:quinone reductase-like Zn-dependent oxidoreductase
MRVNEVEAHASVARATGSRGAQVVFDTVGGPMFEPALSANPSSFTITFSLKRG